MEGWRDWASLVPDLMDLVAARVLAADVVDYMALRAVRARWRPSSASSRDPTLRDPRGWVALCDGDGVRPADSCEVAFLHTATGRCLRTRLPELRGHRIVGFTDGLLILLRYKVRNMESRAWMNAAVCASETRPDSIAVVAWFPTAPGLVVAEPFIPVAPVYSRAGSTASKATRERFFLVESAGCLLVVVCHLLVPYHNHWGLALFEVDTAWQGELTPVTSLGDRALFLGDHRCISVSPNNLPSISGDTIYYWSVGDLDPVMTEYSVSSGACERTSTCSVIHDFKQRIRPSVRPFTLAEHLLTYCLPSILVKGTHVS